MRSSELLGVEMNSWSHTPEMNGGFSHRKHLHSCYGHFEMCLYMNPVLSQLLLCTVTQ